MADRKVFGRVRALIGEDVHVIELTRNEIRIRKLRARKKKLSISLVKLLDLTEGQLQLL